MISVSDEYKALWHQKQKEERLRIRYKRRYYNGSSWVNESDWTVIEQGDFVGIGRINQELDSVFQNLFKISTVTLKFHNRYNEWLQTTVPPSFFAADATATSGYRLFRTLFQVQHGYKLNDGTYEWASQFTGIAIKANLSGSSAVANITVASKAHLAQRADAENVSTTFTLEDCDPAVGDGSETDFKSTSTGVDHLTDFQVDASSITKGSGYRTGNDNEVVSAGNDGKMTITADSAPGNTLTVKCSGLKWLQNNSLETLLGLLFDEADIPSGERTINNIVFPGGLSGSRTIDTEAEWDAGTVFTNVFSSGGTIRQKWFLVDDFADGDYTSNPVWTALLLGGATASAATNALVLSGSTGASGQLRTPLAKNVGTWNFDLTSNQPSDGFTLFNIDQASTSPAYYLQYDHQNDEVKFFVNDGGLGADTELIDAGTVPSGAVNWRITRDADGNFELFKNNVSVGTANDLTFTTFSSISVQISADTPTVTSTWDNFYFSDDIDGTGATSTATAVYESAEFDLLAAPSAWGILDITESLNGGTVVYATNVSSTSGSGYDGYVDINATTKEIESNLKRYLKIRATITPASGSYDSPEPDKLVANFTVTSVNVSLAVHRGKNCLDQIEDYIKLADYELAWRGDGTVEVRQKNISSEPIIHLTQENGIYDVLDYDDGIPDRVVRSAKVRHGEFQASYDGTDAGVSTDVANEEAELAGEIINEDLSSTRLALDVNLAESRARTLYENNRRSATDPRPLRRLRLKVWPIPWAELGDRIRLSFADNPYMLQYLAADPLNKVNVYSNFGNPANLFAQEDVFKILSYSPEYEGENWSAEMLVEEIPS